MATNDWYNYTTSTTGGSIDFTIDDGTAGTTTGTTTTGWGISIGGGGISTGGDITFGGGFISPDYTYQFPTQKEQVQQAIKLAIACEDLSREELLEMFDLALAEQIVDA